jgi:Skp family chaperone for outer membrane proteins
MLQQANMKTMQTMSEKVKEASHTIAQEKKYPLIMNQEQVFHYTSDLDITSEVISKLDEMYVTEEAALAKSKENATASKAATK